MTAVDMVVVMVMVIGRGQAEGYGDQGGEGEGFEELLCGEGPGGAMRGGA